MIENITNPGATPTEGDWVRVTLPSGATIEREYHEPVTLPTPDPVPVTLTRKQFVDLAQEHGGMTDDMLVAAYNNPALRALWIKLDLAQAVERDDPATQNGLTALETLGYLPLGVAAMTAAWPTE